MKLNIKDFHEFNTLTFIKLQKSRKACPKPQKNLNDTQKRTHLNGVFRGCLSFHDLKGDSTAGLENFIH